MRTQHPALDVLALWTQHLFDFPLHHSPYDWQGGGGFRTPPFEFGTDLPAGGGKGVRRNELYCQVSIPWKQERFQTAVSQH